MKYVYLFGGAIGDSLVGTHLGRSLSVASPDSVLILLSTRKNPFVRELTKNLPFVRYRECIKEHPTTWWILLSLLISPTCIFVFEPTDVELPVWWRLILFLATFVPGSREVRSQLVGHERVVKKGVQKIIVHPDDNLFTVNVSRILLAWGLPHVEVLPSLPIPPCTSPARPYMVFHFFAGSYRRSWPLEKVHPFLKRARIVFPEHEFVLTASKEEHIRAEEMIQGISNARIESGLGATELTEKLSCASLDVGVASGVTHISSLLGIPTIALANLSDPYWLPSYAPHTTILANRVECRCKGNKEGDCNESTSQGSVFRCLYFISTDSVIDAMKANLLV